MSRRVIKEVAALLEALDRQTAFAGIPPLAGSGGAKTVRDLSKADWAALCRQFSLKVPSAATIALVAEGIEARRGPVRAVRAQLDLLPERAKESA